MKLSLREDSAERKRLAVFCIAYIGKPGCGEARSLKLQGMILDIDARLPADHPQMGALPMGVLSMLHECLKSRVPTICGRYRGIPEPGTDT